MLKTVFKLMEPQLKLAFGVAESLLQARMLCLLLVGCRQLEVELLVQFRNALFEPSHNALVFHNVHLGGEKEHGTSKRNHTFLPTRFWLSTVGDTG